MQTGEGEMKSAVATIAVAAGLAATPGATTPVFPYPITVGALPNGLRVVMVPYDSPGLVAYYTLVRVGSRNEVEPGHSGFAHLFEHMMFRGTKKFPEKSWETHLKAKGVNTNAFTWNDQTVYHFVAPTAALPKIIEIEADRFQNLSYTKQVFQTETKAVQGEYLKNYSNPEEKMEEVLLDLAFEKHPYKHTTMGFFEDIKKMPERYQYGLGFFRRFYRPDNCIVFVVGDFDPRSTMEEIKKHYGAWAGSAQNPVVPKEPRQRGEKRKAIAWETPTKPRLMVGYHTPSLGADAGAAAAQNILGPYLFGESSPLYRELVLEKQLVEHVRSQYVDTRDPRLFHYLARLKSEGALADVEKAVHRAVKEIRDGVVDKGRLEAVKSNLRYGITMYMETPSRIAEVLALLTTPTGEPGALNALYERIAEVTAADLAAFARKHLTRANRTVVTLTGRAAKKG
jgi:zinc protease